MEMPANDIKAADYIRNLKFDRMETYSLQRGEDYEAKFDELRAERDRLEVRQKKRGDLSSEKLDRLDSLDNLVGKIQYLLDAKGRFHFSSRKTGSFGKDDPVVKELREILSKEPNEILAFLCAPVYRDAFVFYNAESEIVSVLNVCLSCDKMAAMPEAQVIADLETYEMLKRLFIRIGHDVEDPNHFKSDDIAVYRRRGPR